MPRLQLDGQPSAAWRRPPPAHRQRLPRCLACLLAAAPGHERLARGPACAARGQGAADRELLGQRAASRGAVPAHRRRGGSDTCAV